MSFDSVFHGAPTSDNGQSVPGGRATLGIDVEAGVIYYKNPQDQTQAGWQAANAGGTGATKAYVDTHDAATLASSETYTDGKIAAEVTRANAAYDAAGAAAAAQAASLPVASTTLNGITFLHGAVDPSTAAGVAATAPALYIHNTTGQIWSKTGATNTDWTLASAF